MASPLLAAESIAIAVLIADTVPNWYSGLMPSTFTIRTFSDDPEKVRALRRAEVVGSGLALSAGIAGSVLTKSWIPLIMVLVVMAILLFEYENAIKSPINGGVDMRGSM